MATYNLCQFVFDRSRIYPDEDVAVMTCHIREVQQGLPDIFPITDAARDDFVGNVSTWWGVVKAFIWHEVTFREIRFYDVPSTAGADMGDPVRVQGVEEAATATSGALPPQNALSITFRTSKRATWGRFYLPQPSNSVLDVKGRLQTSVADSICTATHSLTNRSDSGASLVVFSRKEWTHHDPQLIQVDDLTDVIRSRRYRATHYRAQLSAG